MPPRRRGPNRRNKAVKPGYSLHTLAGAVVLVIIGMAVGARLARPPAGSDITEGGSPLYKIAVDESIKGLRSKEVDDGSTKDDICPQCGTVHATPAPGSVAPPAAAGIKAGESAPEQDSACPECGEVHASPAPEPGAPCSKCGKIYHLSHGVPASGTVAHSAAGASKDYVYCDKCKVYHRRQVQLFER